MSATTGPSISPLEANDLIEGGALLIDVREPSEWEAGHAPAARHIPLGHLPEELGSVPDDRTVVLVCRMGGRSARATALLLGAGKDAVNLEGGMQAWQAAGLPVEGADGQAGLVA